MKITYVIVALGALLGLGTVSAVFLRSAKRIATPAAVCPAPLDSAQIYDLAVVEKYKVDSITLYEAFKLSKAAEDTVRLGYSLDLARPIFLKAIRMAPVKELYQNYAQELYTDHIAKDRKRLMDIATRLSGRHNDTWVSAAAYALSVRDTDAMLLMLSQLTQEQNVLELIDAREAFKPLENYPDFYYTMDHFYNQAQQKGQMGVLRTLRFTTASGLPYELSSDAMLRSIASDTPGNRLQDMRDDAITDLMRGNRFGKYSRMVERDYGYIATLDLSKSFMTFIYSDRESEGIVFKKDNEDKSEEQLLEEQRIRGMSGTAYYIATIDKQGKVIAIQKIASLHSPVHLTTASVQSDGLIRSMDLTQTWEKEPIKGGYIHNKVIKQTPTATRYYHVETDGSIRDVSDAMARR